MKPVSFKEQTKILQKPSSMTDKECGPLPIWNGDGQRCISCWKANLKERIRFLFTGKIWLWIISGRTQPPVMVSVKFPFIHKIWMHKNWSKIMETISKSMAFQIKCEYNTPRIKLDKLIDKIYKKKKGN